MGRYKNNIEIVSPKIRLIRKCIYDNKTAAKELRRYADEIEKGGNDTKQLFHIVGELFSISKRTIYEYLSNY